MNSEAWINNVHPKVEERGFKPLFYIVIDPRVVALRKGNRKPCFGAVRPAWREIPRPPVR